MEQGDPSPLFSPDETHPRMLGPVLVSTMKDKHRLKQVQQRTANMMKGPEPLIYKERLSKLGLLSLENRRLRGDLMICITT